MIIDFEPIKLQKGITDDIKQCGSFVLIVSNHDVGFLIEYNSYT